MRARSGSPDPCGPSTLPPSVRAYVAYTVNHYGAQSLVMFDGYDNSTPTKTVEHERRAAQSISTDNLFECELKAFLACR